MQPVLILGAGINGAALARELAWQGVPVVVVDRADLASGATAASSRLIHGGLRYLEYGDLALVAESLAERRRLVELAPHDVRPLRLLIPVARRRGGLLAGLFKFLHQDRLAHWFTGPRGLWTVRTGLTLYDRLARDRHWPAHAVYPVGAVDLPPLAEGVAKWWCTYQDAQIAWPERFVVTLLDDARQAALQFDARCEIYPHCHFTQVGTRFTIWNSTERELTSLEPSAIVNATGAWVDDTIDELRLESRPLIQGTKGSHLVVEQAELRAWHGDNGLYVEASDGRPIFILPWNDQTLIGTTDLAFDGDPGEVVASEAEIEYLLSAVNRLLPTGALQRSDVLAHYCGVRPLPAIEAGSTAAISRRHWLHEHPDAPLPTYSVIGGKLTTCRSLAESAADTILARLGQPRRQSTRAAVLPTSRGYPDDHRARDNQRRSLAEQFGLSARSIAAIWRLFGTQSSHVLAASAEYDEPELVTGTDLSRGVVRWVIEHEWVQRLADLVERRLPLLYDRRLSRQTLVELAELLVRQQKLASSQIESEVAHVQASIAARHGRTLPDR